MSIATRSQVLDQARVLAAEIDQKQAELNALLASVLNGQPVEVAEGPGTEAPVGKRNRREMPQESRDRIAAAQRARWAKVKAAKAAKERALKQAAAARAATRAAKATGTKAKGSKKSIGSQIPPAPAPVTIPASPVAA